MLLVVPVAPTIRLEVRRDGVRIVRPGARYVATRTGEEHRGEWQRDGAALPAGASEVFTEAEARLLLPFLRARGTAGRKGSEPTTEDGVLIDRVCEALGLTAAQLADELGTGAAVLSRARGGRQALAEIHRERIREMIAAASTKGQGT